MQLLAPAKINLYLRVGPLGADGYPGFHPLVSWMVTVGLFDTLTFERTEANDVLRFTCDDTSLPTDHLNIVVRTATALFAQRTEPSGSAAGSYSQPDGVSI